MAKARDPFWAFSHRTWKVPWPSLPIHWQSQSPSSFPPNGNGPVRRRLSVHARPGLSAELSDTFCHRHLPLRPQLGQVCGHLRHPEPEPSSGAPCPKGRCHHPAERAARGARPWSAPPVPPPPLARLLTLPSNHPVTSQQCLQHRHLPCPILASLCCYQKRNFALLPASRLPVPPPPPPGPTAVRLNSAGLSPSPSLQDPAWPSKAPAFLLGLISHLPQPGTC